MVQFGVPSSLEVWTQRAGRAGRSPHVQARAVLLAERSMFQQKKAVKKRKINEIPDEIESQSGESKDGSESEKGEEDSRELVWAKMVDPNLREWIMTTGCRRDVSDQYFQNPGKRQGK